LIALTLVIEQGEGATGRSESDPSHYQVFKKLHEEHDLNCWPVVENPKTAEFEKKAPKIYKVSICSALSPQNQSTNKTPQVMVFSDAVVRVLNSENFN